MDKDHGTPPVLCMRNVSLINTKKVFLCYSLKVVGVAF